MAAAIQAAIRGVVRFLVLLVTLVAVLLFGVVALLVAAFTSILFLFRRPRRREEPREALGGGPGEVIDVEAWRPGERPPDRSN